MKGYRKILIAVNGSAHVLEHGLKVAREEKSWVTVLKVVPAYEGDLFLTGIKNIGDALNGVGSEVEVAIRDLANKERMIVKTRIEEGRIHERIVDVAREERCDLIVIGKPVRRGITKFFGDRTAEKVMEQAPCPVLVVETEAGLEKCCQPRELCAAAS